MPQRIQLSRAKGWRMPPNTVKVDRATRWGNPFKVGGSVHRGLAFSGRDEIVRDAAHAAQLFRQWLFTQARSADLQPLLRGKNLACWCKPGDPCHADVLLEIANAPTVTDGACPHPDPLPEREREESAGRTI